MGVRGIDCARRLAFFETDRRATLIVLAIGAYRLDHGDLPASLDQLAPKYLERVPLDPYSMVGFGYFPTGIRVPAPEARAYEAERQMYADVSSWRRTRSLDHVPVELGVPGIWSTGSEVWARPASPAEDEQSGNGKSGIKQDVVMEYGLRLGATRSDRTFSIWFYGDWFPIPKAEVGTDGGARDFIKRDSPDKKEAAR